MGVVDPIMREVVGEWGQIDDDCHPVEEDVFLVLNGDCFTRADDSLPRYTPSKSLKVPLLSISTIISF